MPKLGAQIKEQDQVLWLAERLFQMHVLKVGIVNYRLPFSPKEITLNDNPSHPNEVFEICFVAAGEFYKYAQSREIQEAGK